MLVTDQAKMIRMPLTSLRVIGRGSAGVRLFDVADNEHVVSAARIEAEEEVEADTVEVTGDTTPATETPAPDAPESEA